MVRAKKNHKRGDLVLSQKKIKRSHEKFERSLIKDVDNDCLGIIVVLVILSIGFIAMFKPSAIKTDNEVKEGDLMSAVNSDDLSNCETLSPVNKVICRQTINDELITAKVVLNKPTPVVRFDEDTKIISKAIAAMNSDFCNEITNPVKKDLCFFESSKG